MESEEAQKVKYILPGYHPTSKEIAEHMVNHLPYRAWCKQCVKGKSKGRPQKKGNIDDRKEEDIPVVSFDYMFMLFAFMLIIPVVGLTVNTFGCWAKVVVFTACRKRQRSGNADDSEHSVPHPALSLCPGRLLVQRARRV